MINRKLLLICIAAGVIGGGLIPAVRNATEQYRYMQWKREYKETLREELLQRIDEYSGIYLVQRQPITPSCLLLAERTKKERVQILYPIKGSLKPGAEIQRWIILECLTNDTYLFFFCHRLSRQSDGVSTLSWHPSDDCYFLFLADEDLIKEGRSYQYPHDGNVVLRANSLEEEVFVSILQEKGWLDSTSSLQ